MNLFKCASASAILLASIFLSHSLINLLAFAISTQTITQQMIPENLHPLITSLIRHFVPITQGMILTEALLGALIFFAFERIAKVRKLTTLRISSILALIAVLLSGISILFTIVSIPFPLADKTISLCTGIVLIIFGSTLIKTKISSQNTLLTSLGILQIFQGLILISTFWIPARLLEFSIATYILEAVFFWNIVKEK